MENDLETLIELRKSPEFFRRYNFYLKLSHQAGHLNSQTWDYLLTTNVISKELTYSYQMVSTLVKSGIAEYLCEKYQWRPTLNDIRLNLPPEKVYYDRRRWYPENIDLVFEWLLERELTTEKELFTAYNYRPRSRKII